VAKKRSAEWKKRSRASKKGWITRRKKQSIKREISKQSTLVRNAKRGVKSKKVISELPKIPRKKRSKKKQTIDELEAIIDLQRQQIEILKLTKGWVHAMPPEYLHKDGTIALQPSRARHFGKLTNEALKMMRKAHKKGDSEFNQIVSFLAGHFNLPMREIYTLWYSP